MKKRLLDTELAISQKRLVETGAKRVLVLIHELEWALPLVDKRFDYYVVEQLGAFRQKCVIRAAFDQLPLDSSSVDMVILPHAITEFTRLDAIINAVDRVLKPNGELLFFGINDSKQCSAGELMSNLRLRQYTVLHYRGFHLLPMLGPAMTRWADRCFGQFLPWLSNGFWLCAQKKVQAVKPLRVNFKTVSPSLDQKVRPAGGRLYRENDDS